MGETEACPLPQGPQPGVKYPIKEFDHSIEVPGLLGQNRNQTLSEHESSLVELGKQLLAASKDGDTEAVRLLMSKEIIFLFEKGAPFTADWLGTSPLHLTAQYGRYETTEVLLRAGCSRDARTKVDKTPLHVAAYEGHVDICRLLLKSGAEVDARDILLMTPLHWAVERANIKCIEVLLKHGADPDAQSKFDKSPSDISNDIGRPDLANILQTCESSNITVLEPGELQTVSNFSVINVTRSNQNLSKQDEVKIVKNGAETLTVHLDPVQIALSSAGGISSQDMETQALINSLPDLADTTSTSNSHEQNDTYRLLEAHGIKILPEEEITQTLSLTEAGKLYLSSMPSPTSQFILPDPPPPNESHNEASDEVGLVESNHDNNEEDSPEEIVMIEPKIYQAPVVVSSSSFKSIRSPLNTISISGAGNKMGITKRASYDNNTGNSVSLASRVGSQTTSTSYSRISSSGPVLLRRDNDKTISKPTVLNNIKLSKVMTLSQKESSLSLTNASIDKPRIIKLSGQQFASLKSSSNLNKIVLSPPLSHSPSASLITTTSSLVTSSIGVTGVVSSSSLRGSNSALGRIGVTGLSTSSQGSGSANSLGSIPMKRHTEGISLQPARKIQRIDDSEELKELKLKLSLELKEIERLKQELRERENNADRLQNQIKHLTNSC